MRYVTTESQAAEWKMGEMITPKYLRVFFMLVSFSPEYFILHAHSCFLCTMQIIGMNCWEFFSMLLLQDEENVVEIEIPEELKAALEHDCTQIKVHNKVHKVLVFKFYSSPQKYH